MTTILKKAPAPTPEIVPSSPGADRDWREILLFAADLIETNGWTRREYGSTFVGFCAIGAINKASGLLSYTPACDDEHHNERTKAISKLRDETGESCIEDWNDGLPSKRFWRPAPEQVVVQTMRRAANRCG